MKKYLFFVLTLVFFACGQEDDEVQSSRTTGGADATLGENKFLEEGAYRIDISIDCSKCAEGEQNQEYTLFLDDASVLDEASLKQINYYSYDGKYCEAHTDPAYVEVTVTDGDNASQVYHILETACAFTLNEGRFITKDSYARIAKIVYSGN